MQKRGFISHLFHKRWSFVDFLEPLAGLPFAFGLVFVLENGFDVFGILLAVGLLFVYLPVIIIFFDRVVK